MWIRSGTWSTQPREDNWVAHYREVAYLIKKVDIIRLDEP
jgi:hypothetical protein